MICEMISLVRLVLASRRGAVVQACSGGGCDEAPATRTKLRIDAWTC